MTTVKLYSSGESYFLKVLIALQLMQPADSEYRLSMTLVTKSILSDINSESSVKQYLIMSSSATFFKLKIVNHDCDRILQS